MKQLKWILTNGIMLACLYLATFTQHQGAANIAIFMLWLTISLSLFLPSQKTRDSFIQKKITRAMPAWLDVTYDLIVVAILIYFSWWITGIAYFIQILLTNSFWDAVEKAAKAEQVA